MKLIFTLAITFLFSFATQGQQVGAKVSLVASDGKTYTGVITEVNGDKYKIKYDGFDFTAWLAAHQFTVTEENSNQQNNTATPALPAEQNTSQTMPQPTPETSTQTNPESLPQTTNNKKPKIPITADSLKQAVGQIKDAFGALNKMLVSKRETLNIMISDIDYDNAGLSMLKEGLKKVKGVKSVQMNYKAPNAVLEVAFKGKATDVWDNLPSSSKSTFKLMEMNDNSIILKQKMP